MAWMIIKSAGDEYSFVATKVEGEIGHTYDYACEQARKVTEAMRQYLKSVDLYQEHVPIQMVK